MRLCDEGEDMEGHLSVANELKTALRTQPVSFVLRFISQNGLEQLLNFLVQMNNAVRYIHSMYMYMAQNVSARLKH